MSAAGLNRNLRRRMAANAGALALQLARTALDYDRSGRVVRVTEPAAQGVLCRAFERMLRAGGEPQVVRLSENEAASFPRGGQVPAQGASAWLAAGVDRAGLATYALRWLDVSGLEPMAQRDCAEFALRAALVIECARSGFPVAGHA